MKEKYASPALEADAFNCPHCEAYAEQIWYDAIKRHVKTKSTEGGIDDLFVSQCRRCGNLAFWYNKKMIYPFSSEAPLPAEDMPQDVKADITEARNIVSLSPRASAALLRLGLQKLMVNLGEKRGESKR